MCVKSSRDGRRGAAAGAGMIRSAMASWVRRGLYLLAGAALVGWLGVAQAARSEEEGRAKPFSYHNEKVPAGPWSIHVLKLDRSSQEYEVDTVLARGTILGMETLTDQVKAYPTNAGRPVGAINGDSYRSGRNSYEGDPEGIQITHGELVSSPSGKACFWIDATGRPRSDEVQSLFRVVWPDGSNLKV